MTGTRQAHGRYGIRARFLVPMVLLMTGLSFSLSWLAQRQEERILSAELTRKEELLQEKMREKARELTVNLVLVMERAAAQIDFTYIQSVVEQAAREIADLSHLEVVNPAGKVIFSSRKMADAEIDTRDCEPGKVTIRERMIDGQRVLESIRGIDSGKGTVWGWVILGLTDASLRREMEASRLETHSNVHRGRMLIWLVGAGFAMLGIVLVIWLVKRITAPLVELTSAIGAFREDVAGLTIPVFPDRDEIGTLSQAFALMVERIRAHFTAMSDLNASLERIVEERTRSLQERGDDLEQAHHLIMESLSYAQHIQRSILPVAEAPSPEKGDGFVMWHPRDIVGGDFYWIERAEQGTFLALVDCTGHGVPGALASMTTYCILRRVLTPERYHDPGLVLAELNREVKALFAQGDRDEGMDAACCFISADQRRLIFAGAHADLYLTGSNGNRMLQGERFSIGYRRLPSELRFTNHDVIIDATTVCYLFSDGLYHQLGGKDQLPFGRRRLESLLDQCMHLPIREQRDLLETTLGEYRGTMGQNDDITCLALRLIPRQ
ncbi:MAG: SpoIIE family protein phosphatase [Magnetococcales bacterium]|nr:SpoIIE family protein phosphatase [Magnetococcales bacterium]